MKWTTPGGVAPDAAGLLYLHGGSYVQGAPISNRRIVTSLAIAAGVRAVSVDYRLAPEHPFPAGLDDAQLVYEWLIGLGDMEPSPIVIAGDSAGGGIVAGLRLCDQDIRCPPALC